MTTYDDRPLLPATPRLSRDQPRSTIRYLTNPDDPNESIVGNRRSFESYFRQGREDECWIWRGSLNADGYGVLGVHSKIGRSAHRIAYQRFNGPIPDGMSVCHRCDNRACVNPLHLFLGTNADNIADMVAKGRQSRGPGSKPPAWRMARRGMNAKLSVEQVREILANRWKMSQRELGEKYGVSKAAIGKIQTGRNWGWLR